MPRMASLRILELWLVIQRLDELQSRAVRHDPVRFRLERGNIDELTIGMRVHISNRALTLAGAHNGIAYLDDIDTPS